MGNSSKWFIGDDEISIDHFNEDTLGFIYVITNLVSGKIYVGKKLAWFRKTSLKTITLKNGNTRRKKVTKLVRSDWPSYYGSCTELLGDVEKYGHESFKREIIYTCTSKSEMSYIEALVQFRLGVLLDDRFYNGIINLRVNKRCLSKLTHDGLRKLDEIILRYTR